MLKFVSYALSFLRHTHTLEFYTYSFIYKKDTQAPTKSHFI